MDQSQQNCFYAGAPTTVTTSTAYPPPPAQKKRTRQQITVDDDDVEVIALSVEEINGKPLFPCEFCNKGFAREQNLLIHRRAHYLPYVRNNLPVKNNDDEKRKVYVCPETACANHHPSKALCDLASLKKHFKRKHGEKTMKCTKCEKTYAVEGDLRAHIKICGNKEYVCLCGSFFSRRECYLTHKLLCDIARANQFYLLQNKFQSNQTTVGGLQSISYPNNLQPALDSNSTTSTHYFPFLSDTIVVPPVPISFAAPNQSIHGNMTIDSVNNGSTDESDNIFDVNVLHERLFGVSSVPAHALPQGPPEQGYSLANSGTSSPFFLQSLKSPPSADFNKGNFSVYPNVSGTYENLDQVTGGARDPLIGDYRKSPVRVNKNIFGTSLEDKATPNSGPSGFGVDDQIKQLVQLPGHKFGDNADSPVLQNNFHFGRIVEIEGNLFSAVVQEEQNGDPNSCICHEEGSRPLGYLESLENGK